MDLEARPYRAFVRVAETGSFSRAAEALNISQPALSAQVRELERQLGFALFTRTSRRVELTPEGRQFLDRARRLIIETDWINQSAREIRTNALRIGAAHFTAQIAERRALIEGFMGAEPAVPLQVSGRSHAQLLADLARGDIDLAITIEPSGAAATPSLVEPDAREFERWVVAERPVRLLMPEAEAWPLALADLAGREIGMINRAHGIGLSEIVAHGLSGAGARLWHPPEGDAPALARYGALTGRPVIDLGWFERPDGMAAAAIEGFDVATALVVIAERGPRRAGATRFLEFVSRLPG